MKFEIRNAENGHVLKLEDLEEEIVCQEDFEDESDAFAAFLRTILDYYGPSSSRYDRKRIYVVVKPGDKSELAEICECCGQIRGLEA